MNLADGRLRPRPNFDLVSSTMSSVPDIGISNQDRINLVAMLSTLFFTHVSEKQPQLNANLSLIEYSACIEVCSVDVVEGDRFPIASHW